MSKEWFEASDIPDAPQGATWVERVVRPDMGLADRVKLGLRRSTGLIGNKILESAPSSRSR